MWVNYCILAMVIGCRQNSEKHAFNICPSLAVHVLLPAVDCLTQCNWCFNLFLSWQSKIPGKPLLVAILIHVLTKCPWTQHLTEILACLDCSSCFCSMWGGSFCLFFWFSYTSVQLQRHEVSLRYIYVKARDIGLDQLTCSWHSSAVHCINCQLHENLLGK